MNVAVTLVRTVFRAFYTDEECAVIEPLLREPFYLEDDNETKGSLSDALGGIHALKVRRVLVNLKNESMVHEELVGSKTYNYIDFIHFIKIVRLRVAKFADFVKSDTKDTALISDHLFECPRCARKYTALQALGQTDAQTNQLLCQSCGAVLREISGAAESLTGKAPSRQKSVELKRKFDEHTAKALGLREGISELLKMADSVAAHIPDNLPSLRLLHQLQRERAAERAAQQRSGRRPGEDDELDVKTVATLIKPGAAELVPWLAKSSVTNLETEAGMQSRLEQEAKRRRQEDDVVADLKLEPLPEPVEGQGEIMFKFADGRTAPLDSITLEDLGRMTKDEEAEYRRLRDVLE